KFRCPYRPTNTASSYTVSTIVEISVSLQTGYLSTSSYRIYNSRNFGVLTDILTVTGFDVSTIVEISVSLQTRATERASQRSTIVEISVSLQTDFRGWRRWCIYNSRNFGVLTD